ncbi:MAG: hypothetical protein LBP92_06725 [Deltaproteobacteria bacterium]|nr:hypothetical protein [Deltaproteobacteria bacterium]
MATSRYRSWLRVGYGATGPGPNVVQACPRGFFGSFAASRGFRSSRGTGS